jgi:23S rRNA pseudouridine1911/1915/1917 synthase
MDNNESTTVSRILYRDDSVAVVYKKIGEVCENSAADRALSLIENIRVELERAVGHALPELEAVHRIDQPVSGCVLVALDKQALSFLSAEFASSKIRKRYLAIVEKPESPLSTNEGRLVHMIRFDHKHHKAHAVIKEELRDGGPDWKSAVLEWRLVAPGDRYLFLEVTPETGRTHQIRAQLAAVGMAIKGDLKYGARRSDPLGGIRLHAYAIQFTHPVSGNSVTVTAPVQNPDSLWSAFMEKLG